MRRPSGDQDGPRSRNASSVRRRYWLPSIRVRNRSSWTPERLKTIHCPSGEMRWSRIGRPVLWNTASGAAPVVCSAVGSKATRCSVERQSRLSKAILCPSLARL